jgi:hypothetical protein
MQNPRQDSESELPEKNPQHSWLLIAIQQNYRIPIQGRRIAMEKTTAVARRLMEAWAMTRMMSLIKQNLQRRMRNGF